MSSSAQETFVLVGVHAGKDIQINGHQFEDGEFHFQGSPEQVIALTNVFSYYGAVPKAIAKNQALEAELAALRAQVQGQQASAVDLVQQTAAPALDIAAVTIQEPAAAPTQVAQPAAASAAPTAAVVTLGEAIGALDPEADGDWTSNNLPSLDRLAELVGKKPSRDEVEAIATGYTRAKARAARA
jgi:hypothetical protein